MKPLSSLVCLTSPCQVRCYLCHIAARLCRSGFKRDTTPVTGLAGDGRYFHAYSRDNIYWLGWERRAATRMAVVPAPSIDTRPPAARAAPLRRHQHLEYDRLFVRLGLHFRALSEPAAFAQPVQKEPSTGDTRLPCLHLPTLGWPRPAFCPAGRRRQLGH